MKRRRVRKTTYGKKSKRLRRITDVFLRLNARTQIIIAAGAGVLIIGLILMLAIPKGAPAMQQASTADLPVQTESGAVTDVVIDSDPAPTPSVTPSPTLVPTPTPDPTLQKGDENERVQQLQERLMDLGYMVIDESTQYYGPATTQAVWFFQRQHDLQQDGIAGPETLDMIHSDDAKKYTLLEGTTGTDVDSLQRQLIDLGYLNKSTGYYGTETMAAVEAFQECNDLHVDGKTGENTLDMLYSPDAKVSSTKVKAEKRRANILTVLEVAEDQLGDRYILGNEGPDSFDCSGLVYYCLKQAGSSRGRYNAAGYSKVSEWDKIESMNNLEKGDLLFFWSSSSKTRVGHVGIYVGNGMMIDASSSNGKVVHRSCRTSYWERMFVCGRRPW